MTAALSKILPYFVYSVLDNIVKRTQVFRICLFGPFQVSLSGTPLTAFHSNKTRALLSYLLTEANQPHSRDFLATLLWSDQTNQRARTNLRTTLAKLRKLLAPLEKDTPLFTTTRHSIQLNLNPTHHWVDVVAFNDLLTGCEEAQSDTPACIEAMTQAATLYQGDFLSDLLVENAAPFEGWRLQQQEAYHWRMLALLERLTNYYMWNTDHQGDYQIAEQYARWQLNLEPWAETAHYQLMEILAKTGQQAAALAQYETCRQLLAEELNTTPSPQTVALVEQIRQGELASVELIPPSNSAIAELDWGELPLVGTFFGRAAELAHLKQWLVEKRERLVIILGMGGLGKTALAAQVAREVAGDFEIIIWRSLLNAPTLDELLPGILQTLNDPSVVDYPASLAKKLDRFLEHLRQRRCLVVLDNLEALLQSNQAGQYRPGYEAYGHLIDTLASREHQSCLLLTSREQPQRRLQLQLHLPGTQTLLLTGVDLVASQQILQARGVSMTQAEADILTDRYSGNPLALNLLAQTIQVFYFGDVAAFLGEETPIFDDIRGVLDQQFNRLSALEQDILLWLAISREPLSLPDLTSALVGPVRQRTLIEALHALQRRSLLERNQAGFTLQNVVTEYLTDKLIEQVSQEVESGAIRWLNSHALLQAQAKTYVRLSQTRLILHPLAEQLLARLGLSGVDQTCCHLLDHLRQETLLAPGYAAGNLLNLLLYLKIDVTDYNFSGLSMWQADLRGRLLSEVNFAGADLSRSVFTDIFGFIYSVAFRPDGRLLAAAGSDGSIRLWQTETYQPVAMLTEHTEIVWAITFSPDGRTLASTSADGTIRLWGIATGQSRYILKGGKSGVQAVAFSPDGALLAGGGRDHEVYLWSLADIASLEVGQAGATLQGHTDSIQSVAFSPDGQILASGSRDKTVRLWETNGGQLLGILRGHTNWVNAIAFSPNGKTLASAGEDGRICLWDMSALPLTSSLKSEPEQALSSHTSGVQTVTFSPDGQTLASAGSDYRIRLWNVATGQTRHMLSGHTNWVRSITFSPDGQSLASGSWDHTVRLWDANPHSGYSLRTLQGYTNLVFSLAFSPNGKLLSSSHSDGTIRLWDVPTGHCFRTLQGHTNWVWHVAFSPDGQTLASSSFDGTVRLWDTVTGQPRHLLQGHQGGVQVVAFSPDGQTLASSSIDHTVRLWNVATGQHQQTLHHHTNWSLSVAFSPDGQVLASSSADRSIVLWEVSTGKIYRILTGHQGGVQNISFSPDGTLLASISWDKTVRLWEVASGQICHILPGHTSLGQGIVFSPDGQTLVSSSYDRTVRLWEVSSGQLCHVLEGHNNWVFYVTYSPDGTLLASSSADATIKLWQPDTGHCLQTFQAPAPYAGMNISGVSGITEAQRSVLKELGAVERV